MSSYEAQKHTTYNSMYGHSILLYLAVTIDRQSSRQHKHALICDDHRRLQYYSDDDDLLQSCQILSYPKNTHTNI